MRKHNKEKEEKKTTKIKVKKEKKKRKGITFLKHKESQEIPFKSVKKHGYLRKESVEMSSIYDIDLESGYVTTKSKMRGKIYQFTFKVPNGLSPQTDAENKRLFTYLISSCNGKIKVWELNEQKSMLRENMELLKERVKSAEQDDTLLDVIVNRYSLMQTFEKMNYLTGYIYVDENINKFEELASSFLNLYTLTNNDLLNFLERIHNNALIAGGDDNEQD